MDKQVVLQRMQMMAGYIDSALREEGLSAQLIRAKRSYLSISFQLSLHQPTRQALSAIGNLGPVLEQLSGIAPVRVDRSGGGISVEFPSPFPETPSALAIAKHMKGANICLGFDNWSEPVHVALKERNVVAFIGAPGSGKSTALRSVLYGILATNPIKFMVMSVKGDEWLSFAKTQACVGLYTNTDQILEILDQGVQHLTRLSEEGRKSKPTLLVVDDMHGLLKNDKEIANLLGTMFSIGRALGFYALISTVSWGSKETSGGFEIEDSVAARVVFSTSSNLGAARATGRKASGLTELTGLQGDALLITPRGQSRITTGWVTDEMVAKLPQSNKPILLAQPEPKTAVRKIEAVKVEPKPEPIVNGGYVEQQPQPPQPRPPRLLTGDEVEQAKAYFEWYKRVNGTYPSQKAAIEAIYGSKYPKTIQLFKESLGEYADKLNSGVKPPGRSKKDPSG